MESANVALCGFARQDYQGILPDSDMQQRAYITFCMTSKRVSPNDFVNYLATATSSAGNSAEVIQELWTVPNINFPGELLEEIAANM